MNYNVNRCFCTKQYYFLFIINKRQNMYINAFTIQVHLKYLSIKISNGKLRDGAKLDMELGFQNEPRCRPKHGSSESQSWGAFWFGFSLMRVISVSQPLSFLISRMLDGLRVDKFRVANWIRLIFNNQAFVVSAHYVQILGLRKGFGYPYVS